MLDLISTTEDIHYENYRQQQMETRKFGEPRVKKSDNPKFKEEEEALRKRFTEQVKSEEARFRQWEQHVRFVLIKKKLSSLCSPPLAAHRGTRPTQ
jgi:cell division control protein 12